MPFQIEPAAIVELPEDSTDVVVASCGVVHAHAHGLIEELDGRLTQVHSFQIDKAVESVSAQSDLCRFAVLWASGECCILTRFGKRIGHAWRLRDAFRDWFFCDSGLWILKGSSSIELEYRSTDGKVLGNAIALESVDLLSSALFPVQRSDAIGVYEILNEDVRRLTWYRYSNDCVVLEHEAEFRESTMPIYVTSDSWYFVQSGQIVGMRRFEAVPSLQFSLNDDIDHISKIFCFVNGSQCLVRTNEDRLLLIDIIARKVKAELKIAGFKALSEIREIGAIDKGLFISTHRYLQRGARTQHLASWKMPLNEVEVEVEQCAKRLHSHLHGFQVRL